MCKNISAAEAKKSYKKAIKAMEQEDGDIEEAIALLKAAAEQGDVDAQYKLGEYYAVGYFVEYNLKEAVFWYEESAKGKNVKAAEALMWLYCDDCPDDIDDEQANKIARKWYDEWIGLLKEKAEKGSVRAKKKLADILYSGDGVPQIIADNFSDEDDDKALEESIELFKQAAEQGDAEAYYSLGNAYDYLGASKEDLKKSFNYFAAAAQMGYSRAYVCLGSAYFQGKGVEKDWIKAREMYIKGAEMGDIYAKRELADCYKRGIGGEKDYQKALELYLDAAKAKDNYALYELGSMYLKGLGVEANLQKAYEYFVRAVKYGSRAAENALSSKKFRDFKK
ncbi:MAG: sel1 repeat family protein [Lachnospiraceae bacterium]|nr:sel1 repeat family protein [Lachnospiraceae bacterium]